VIINYLKTHTLCNRYRQTLKYKYPCLSLINHEWEFVDHFRLQSIHSIIPCTTSVTVYIKILQKKQRWMSLFCVMKLHDCPVTTLVIFSLYGTAWAPFTFHIFYPLINTILILHCKSLHRLCNNTASGVHSSWHDCQTAFYDIACVKLWFSWGEQLSCSKL
jgi:hypothetical protein